MSAVNFNDNFIKIGADVSQLAESQIEESKRGGLGKIECTQARDREPELWTLSILSCVTQYRTTLKDTAWKNIVHFYMNNKKNVTLQSSIFPHSTTPT